METNPEYTTTSDLQERLRDRRNALWWANITNNYIKQMQNLGSMLPRDYLRSLAYWLSCSTSNLGITQRELLVEYITGFTRLVINLGSYSEKEAILASLDAAIEFYSSIDENVTELYITKSF